MCVCVLLEGVAQALSCAACGVRGGALPAPCRRAGVCGDGPRQLWHDAEASIGRGGWGHTSMPAHAALIAPAASCAHGECVRCVGCVVSWHREVLGHAHWFSVRVGVCGCATPRLRLVARCLVLTAQRVWIF